MNKYDGLMNALPAKRYKNFVTTVADLETVWVNTEWDDLTLLQNELSVWPEKIFAQGMIEEQMIHHMEVHLFCELLEQYPNAVIHVFPNGVDSIDVSALKLLQDIEEELDRIE